MDSPVPRLVPASRFVPGTARAFAMIAAGFGFAGFMGWVLGVPALKSVVPGLASMKANTALSVLLEGVALALLAWSPRADPPRRAARVLAATAGLIGALSLVETLFDLGFGIDELLFRDTAAGSLPYYPGRMAPTTATCFVLIAAAVLCPLRRGLRTPEILALSAMLLGTMSLVSYAFGVKPDTQVTFHTTQMAVHTSAAFVLLGSCVLLLGAERGLLSVILADDAGGLLARQLLPAAVGVPLLAGAALLLGARAGWYSTTFVVAGLVVATMAVLSSVTWLTAASIGQLDTARREAVEATRRLNSELERRVADRTSELSAAVKELEGFCYSVSHDLQSPLQTIDGFSAALQEDLKGKLASDDEDALRRVRAAAQLMGRLIEGLLAMSRLARAEMKREPVDLTAIAQSVLSDLRAREPQRKVDVSVAPSLRATGDPRLLRVVLQNLLDNAWKFTSRKDRASIEFGAADGEFFVRDDGAGFDPALSGRLFGAFERLHSASEFPGHGVGLATVQRIVERHGGRIRAEGAPGRGATFRFSLGEAA